MSYYVALTIGGAITQTAFARVIEAASDSDLKFEQSDEFVRDVVLDPEDPLSKDIPSFLNDREQLQFCSPQNGSNRLELLEAACRSNDVPFIVLVDGDAEGDAHARWWCPGYPSPRETITNLDHQPVLVVADVASALEEGTLTEVIERHTMPVLPPLQIET